MIRIVVFLSRAFGLSLFAISFASCAGLVAGFSGERINVSSTVELVPGRIYLLRGSSVEADLGSLVGLSVAEEPLMSTRVYQTPGKIVIERGNKWPWKRASYRGQSIRVHAIQDIQGALEVLNRPPTLFTYNLQNEQGLAAYGSSLREHIRRAEKGTAQEVCLCTMTQRLVNPALVRGKIGRPGGVERNDIPKASLLLSATLSQLAVDTGGIKPPYRFILVRTFTASFYR